jgi:hypothetical protein
MTCRRASDWAARGLLLLACTLVPACGTAFRPAKSRAAKPVVLLQDDFSGGLSANWETLTPTSAIDSTSGNPPPSLSLKAGSTQAEARTNQRFSTLQGLTVAVDVQVSDGTFGDVLILDQDNMTTIKTGVAIAANGANFSINGQVQSVPWTDGAGFHRFAFSLRPDGSAKWSRDGSVVMTGSYPVSGIVLSLVDFISGTNFDNVLISSP